MSTRSVASPLSSSEAGFSLVEVLASIVLLLAVALGVAQLFAVGTTANFRAKSQTSAIILASQKLEQLKALTWSFDPEGLPVSDTTTRVDAPEPTGGGRGLNPSPANSLTTDVDGYVDYLDPHGDYLGTSPDGAAYCRRWAVQPLPTNPNNTLIFQVRVIPMGQLAASDTAGSRALDEATLFTMKTRKAP
jgi:type II secretory pathway pseudopilin PulG